MPQSCAAPTYQRRHPEDTALYRTVKAHLETFLAQTAGDADTRGLPAFVQREFEAYLRCGILAHGFARVRCEGCAVDHLVPFSCKGRGFCPSCGGRRMTAHAAHLVEAVLPWVPVRQWVLTLPYRLRYRLAWDHRLTRTVLGVYTRVLRDFYARDARGRGLEGGRTGMVTAIQRFGSGVNLNVHFHTLVLDGVFCRVEPDQLRFHAAPSPSDEAVAVVLATIRRRVQRLLGRRSLESAPGEPAPADPVAEASPVMAALASASVGGRVALGPRAGRRVGRLGDPPGPPGPPAPPALASRSPRQAHLEGFDLHANVRVPPRDRARLEQLCRYVLRPPLAQSRLGLLPDGQVVVTLKATWRDGTRALVFHPVEFLAALAVLTPRPEINLLLYHGLLAPHARWRPEVVGYGRVPPEAAADDLGEPRPGPPLPSRNWSWAALMRRTFAIDVLACPHCGGRMRVIATIEDPVAVRRILAARRPTGPAGRDPPAGAPAIAS